MRRFALVLTMLALVIGTAAVAYGAEEGTKVVKMNLMTLIGQSGVIGIFILLLSFVGLALIIEHAVTIRRDKLLPQYFVVELEELFENEEYEEALQFCESEDNLLSRVVASGLSKVDLGYTAMEESMSEAAEESSMTLQQKISYVSLIAAIAPMLGLLGTVMGMMGAFATLAQKAGAASPGDLAGDISMALMTTIMGLIVAIPLMGAHHFFRNKVMRLDMEAGVIAGDLMQRFRPNQKVAS